jgi:hypothetical protein
VALIVALATPLLVAMTGLSVDVGYWYEQEEALQSAVDAAALAAATAAANYGASTTAVAEPFAVAAANNATQNQFGFTAQTLALTSTSVTLNGVATTQWVASATIPRGSFFSAVSGLGFLGVPLGKQSASAVADLVPASSTACLIATTGAISLTGGGSVTGTNCGISSNQTTGCSMLASGSGKIIGTAVSTPAGCVTVSGSGYIGTNPSATPSNSSSTVTLNASAAADPLASMNTADTTTSGMSIWNPGWTTPSPPSETTSAITPTLGYNTWTQTGVGDCLVLGAYNAGCELYPNYLTGMTGFSIASLLLNEGTTTGTGGFSGQTNATTTLNGNNYYINGGMKVTSGTAFTIGSSAQTSPVTMVVNGGTFLTNGYATFYPGTYYLNGAKSSGNYSGWALGTNISSTLTLKGSTYYVNGGIGITNGSPQVTLGSGLYELTSYYGNSNSGSSGTGAFYAGQGTYVFGNSVTNSAAAPNTYFFDGGLTISGGASSVIFNPGIYYIRNGNLNIGSASKVIGNGVTFVLEGNAGFNINAGASVSLSAPTTNCVAPANFPESSYLGSASPYDGTDGEGICGVLIYQSRGDAAADSITAGGSGVFNGAIYAPDAPLTVSGGGSLTITTTAIPGLEVASVTDSGSGTISLTETSSTGTTGGATSTSPMLVQ